MLQTLCSSKLRFNLALGCVGRPVDSADSMVLCGSLCSEELCVLEPSDDLRLSSTEAGKNPVLPTEGICSYSIVTILHKVSALNWDTIFQMHT